jgi:hypothetical protein
MIAKIDGVVKQISKVESNGAQIQVKGKPLFRMVVEQPTDGLTERVYITTTKNSRKLGESVSLRCLLYLKKTDKGTYLKVMEVE